MATNLQLLHEEVLTGSTSTINMTNCFYGSYKDFEVHTNLTKQSGNTGTNLKLIDSAGSVNSDSTYDWGLYVQKSNTGWSELRDVNKTSWENLGGVHDANGGKHIFRIYNPISSTQFTYFQSIGTSWDQGALRGYRGLGVFSANTSMYGLQLGFNDAPVEIGKISVYGVK